MDTTLSGNIVFGITVMVMLLVLLWAQAVMEHEEREKAEQHRRDLDARASIDTHKR